MVILILILGLVNNMVCVNCNFCSFCYSVTTERWTMWQNHVGGWWRDGVVAGPGTAMQQQQVHLVMHLHSAFRPVHRTGVVQIRRRRFCNMLQQFRIHMALMVLLNLALRHLDKQLRTSPPYTELSLHSELYNLVVYQNLWSTRILNLRNIVVT